ncbi:cytochrome P450 714C2-like [Pyrus ussuriensis x Pyrus communis]|uniref:Cytochrome P450 714C2-like n=1 Tax=Pyrus ussuriensis x Pyrus communis TaxID=2448454 RepID=A0A5N5EWV1_9ROSA|nr:cytochrome P450 714C2-like [Pyrus ussuriensis x Pyrus communis]
MAGDEVAAAVAANKLILHSVYLGGFLVWLLHLFELVVLRPKRLRSKLQKQGIEGPPPSFLLGNLPAMRKSLIQHKTQSSTETRTSCDVDVASWQIYVCGLAHKQQLCITDVEVLKEIGFCKSLNLGKSSLPSTIGGPLFWQGLLSSNGIIWAHQGKIIALELYLDKVKGGLAEIRVDQNLRNLSADIIARACFRSSYHEGEEIFVKFRALKKVVNKGMMGTPGFRLLPTKDNREIWRLEKEVESMILKLVKQRVEALNEKDLLQMILEGAKSSADYNGLSHNKFIVDNCTTLFFAGHETIASTASWSLMLLAAHPDWQARVRAEVLEICGDKPLNNETLRKMKVLKMVIKEVLRLYAPAVFVTREALETVTLKNVVIPKGVQLQIRVPFLHQNPDLWGLNAHQFNPERFANGILAACQSSQAYMPFGNGPRICVGRHLAMTELKVMLALILSKFSFSLSPTYQRSPVYTMVVEREHGIILHATRV